MLDSMTGRDISCLWNCYSLFAQREFIEALQEFSKNFQRSNESDWSVPGGYNCMFQCFTVSQMPHATLEVQILRPCDLISIKKKIVKWMGNDSRLKRTTLVKRVSVKLVVELTPKGKTLTFKSVDAIAAAYPSTTQQK